MDNPIQRSDSIYPLYADAEQKFDYYVVGLAVAVFAYLGARLEPAPLTFSPHGAYLLGLILLFVSVLIGLKKLEERVRVNKLQFLLSRRESERSWFSELSGPATNIATGKIFSAAEICTRIVELDADHSRIDGELQRLVNRSGSLFDWRNRTMVLGFFFILGSKIWEGYV